MKTKECKKCGISKGTSDFYKRAKATKTNCYLKVLILKSASDTENKENL